MQGWDCAPIYPSSPSFGPALGLSLPRSAPQEFEIELEGSQSLRILCYEKCYDKTKLNKDNNEIVDKIMGKGQIQVGLGLLGIFSPNARLPGGGRLGWEGCPGVMPGMGNAALRSRVQRLHLGVTGSGVQGGAWHLLQEGSEHAAPHPSLPAAAVPLCHHLPPLCLHQPLLWQQGFPGQQLSHL